MEYLNLATLVMVAGLIYMILRNDSINKINRRTFALQRKMDRILKHLGIEEPADLEWQALARDPAKKIAAIKAYRDATGAGLREAKDAVEQWVAEHVY